LKIIGNDNINTIKRNRQMSELIDITKPVWTKAGVPVTDLTVYEGISEWPLISKQLGMGWTATGINAYDQVRETDDDLTHTQPAEAAASQLAPETLDLIAENAALHLENEHLKQEVIRMHAEYRTLWDMTKKIQGRRETSR
jgi:hypothetical protein